MKQLIVAVALVCSTVSVFAADPMAGTFKLNLAKSKMPKTAGLPTLQEVLLVNREQGDDILVTVSGMMSDGTPLAEQRLVPYRGNLVKTVGTDSDRETILSARPDPYTFNYVVSVRGSEVSRFSNTLSRDGKTLTRKTIVVAPDGKRTEAVQVFDRQ